MLYCIERKTQTNKNTIIQKNINDIGSMIAVDNICKRMLYETFHQYYKGTEDSTEDTWHYKP